MERLIENEVLSLDYEPTLSLFIERWYGHVTDQNFKASLLLLVKHLLLLKPIKKIMVYPNFNYLIKPTMQEWMLENVFNPSRPNQSEKIAFFIPQNMEEKILVELLAVMRVMEDTKGSYQIKYFYDEDQAYQWLLE
ncbi:MAG: hypothetical protein EAZ85_03600 [Bacteroidetes bacterium]|nr:MAG: hypothetical protein EAZ85_03600 [Bacteroidota bacterium]